MHYEARACSSPFDCSLVMTPTGQRGPRGSGTVRERKPEGARLQAKNDQLEKWIPSGW